MEYWQKWARESQDWQEQKLRSWKQKTETGIANVSKISLILIRLIREIERDGGHSLRNSKVCLPENIWS